MTAIYITTTTKTTTMTKITCPKCKKRWDYNGSNKVNATCPDCKGRVPL